MKFDGITEQLVDAEAVGAHLGFHASVIRRMAKSGRIPSLCLKNGKKSYYRFRVSEVETALRRKSDEQ